MNKPANANPRVMTSTEHLRNVVIWLLNAVVTTAMIRADTKGLAGIAWLTGWMAAFASFVFFVIGAKLQPAILSLITFAVLMAAAVTCAYVGNYVLALVYLATAYLSGAVAKEHREHHAFTLRHGRR